MALCIRRCGASSLKRLRVASRPLRPEHSDPFLKPLTPRLDEVGVVLRRDDRRGVAQENRYVFDGHALREQVSGKRVAEHVRVAGNLGVIEHAAQ